MAHRHDSTDSENSYPVPLSPYSSLAGALETNGPSSSIYGDVMMHNREWAFMGGSLMWPTNHVLVPQISFSEELATPKSYPDMKYPPIVFQLVDFPEVGVRISKVIAREAPRIAGGDDKVLNMGDREIKIWLLWPGYDEPLQKRMKTHAGTITRDTLLIVIANMVMGFMEKTKNSQLPAKRGYESWTIGNHPSRQAGIMGPELFITRLIHRGGANWQPELWAPRFN